MRPSLPTPETSAGDPPSAATSLSIASPVPIATALGRNSRTCLAITATLLPAASATTSTRSACVRATSSALVPMEPVEPRMAMRVMAKDATDYADSQMRARLAPPGSPA